MATRPHRLLFRELFILLHSLSGKFKQQAAAGALRGLLELDFVSSLLSLLGPGDGGGTGHPARPRSRPRGEPGAARSIPLTPHKIRVLRPGQ